MILKSATQTLTGRIMAAMTVMTAIVGLAYCFAVYTSVMLAETTLIGGRLETELKARIEGNRSNNPSASVIYTDSVAHAKNFAPIPEKYAELPDGFSEIVGEHDRFVFKLTTDNGRWLIEQDQFGFEALEIELYSQAVAGLFLAIGVAAALGYWLARSIVTPVKNLAKDVRLMSENRTLKFEHPITGEDEIAELARTLEDTFGRLHEALAREKAFTADVGHELRTPLMVISSSLEVLSAQYPQLAQARPLERIREASERMTRLVQVFLELARGKIHSEMPEGDLIETLGNIVSVRQTEAAAKGLELSLKDFTQSPKTVNAILFYCLVDNLVQNAVRYTETGSVTVSVTQDTVTVADTGPGLDLQSEDVFKAFVRGKDARGPGYGWGLSLVLRICEHTGWKLRLRANRPQGTVFEITGF